VGIKDYKGEMKRGRGETLNGFNRQEAGAAVGNCGAGAARLKIQGTFEEILRNFEGCKWLISRLFAAIPG
jgi:hypothetical protein